MSVRCTLMSRDSGHRGALPQSCGLLMLSRDLDVNGQGKLGVKETLKKLTGINKCKGPTQNLFYLLLLVLNWLDLYHRCR